MLLRNTVAGWLYKGVSLAAALVTTPIMVHYLGVTGYGVWVLAMTVWGIINLAELGLFTAMTRTLAVHLGREDEANLRAALATGHVLYALLGLVLMALYLAMSQWGLGLVNLTPEFTGPFARVLMLLGLAVGLTQVGRVYETLLYAREDLHLVQVVHAGGEALRFALVITLLAAGLGLMGVAWAFSLTLLAEAVGLFLMGRRVMPRGAALRFGLHGGQVREIVSFAAHSWLPMFTGQGKFQLPAAMLGSMGTPAGLARYGVGIRLLLHLRPIVGPLGDALVPRYSQQVARAELDAAALTFLRASRYTLLLGGYFFLGAWFVGPAFFLAWLGPEFAESALVVRILAAPILIHFCLGPAVSLLMGMKKQMFLGWLNLVEIAIMAGLGWWLIPTHGATGAAIAVGVAIVAARPWALPAYTCRALGIPSARFWRGPALATVAATLAAGLPLAALFHFWTLAGWLEVVAGGLVVTALCLPLFWLVGLSREERVFWHERLAGLAGRIGNKESKA